MITLYTWNTPNGYKVPILLEELGISYTLIPIDIHANAQKSDTFTALNSNQKIPVLQDELSSGEVLTLSESGAILMYLAEKYHAFLSADTSTRFRQLQWLMFQMSAIGPMFGQANHFLVYAPHKVEYGITRYTTESQRLMRVLDTQLEHSDYVAGDYSIADIATWPWVKKALTTGFVKLSEYPHVQRWYQAIEERPAVIRALSHVDKMCT